MCVTFLHCVSNYSCLSCLHLIRFLNANIIGNSLLNMQHGWQDCLATLAGLSFDPRRTVFPLSPDFLATVAALSHYCHRTVYPRYITAQDIILPPSVEIVDTSQPIANLTEPIDFCIELQIKRDRGYQTELRKNYQDGSYPIDAVSMPVEHQDSLGGILWNFERTRQRAQTCLGECLARLWKL
jgi:hypothetical protein